MSVNGLGSYTSQLRLTGLSGSGIDTDSIVESLMSVEKMPIDKLGQKRQISLWKMEAYREVSASLQGFKSTFFDVLNPSSNMLSQSNYKKFTATATGNGATSTVVSATGSSEALVGTHTMVVNKIATAGVSTGTVVSEALTGTALLDENVAAMSGQKFNITLDGLTKEIEIGSYTTVDELAAGLQSEISTAFGQASGQDKISVTNNGGSLTFAANVSTVSEITVSTSGTDTGITSLGFTSGDSNRINTSMTLAEMADKLATPLTFVNDQLTFTINSKSFTFDSSDSLSSMMSTINSDVTANVNMTYDEASDKFSITAKQLGAGDNIVISQSAGNFFGVGGASGIITGSATTTQGQDAEVVLDGQSLVRSSNSIEMNGVSYTLLAEAPGETQTVTLAADVDTIYGNIKNFVDKYNEIISTLNSKISETYDSDYQPLTDEQKSEMSETEIETWETTAKTGLLRNDSYISNMLFNMRIALSDSISGVNSSLSNIGITTGSYEEQGKLIIDETALKEAIENDPDTVMNLFSQKSDISYTETSQRSERYAEEGLAYRIYDIFQDNIRTTRDSSGQKGFLLEKAGIVGDLTEFTSTLYKEISEYTSDITDLTDLLYDKENAYYAKFTAMETFISEMSSQSSWLSSQFSTDY